MVDLAQGLSKANMGLEGQKHGHFYINIYIDIYIYTHTYELKSKLLVFP